MRKERPCWTNFFLPKIEEEDIGNICFQQDGATCHTAEATLDVLRAVFEDRIDAVWPLALRRCDLTPLDCYFCGVIIDKCYAYKPETIDGLKDNICEAIGEIQLHTFDHVGYCIASRGRHLNEIIFHYYAEGLYFQVKIEIWENIQ